MPTLATGIPEGFRSATAERVTLRDAERQALGSAGEYAHHYSITEKRDRPDSPREEAGQSPLQLGFGAT